MRFTKPTISAILIGTGICVIAGPAVVRLLAQAPLTSAVQADEGQDQAPNRREFTVTARDFHFSPARLEVTQDDLVKMTVRSEDVAYSLTIDEYRLSKRVPPRGETTLEFRADRPGTFRFYSNLTSDARHKDTRGEIVVRPR